MKDTNIEQKVKEIYKVHCDIHNIKNVVDYALLDDCVRKIKLSKEELKPIVDRVIKERK